MQEKIQYKGLTALEVEQSRREHGSNVFTEPARTPVWKKFLEKFTDPLIIILLIAGLLSVGISLYEFLGEGHSHGDSSVFFEPVGIFVAIFLATGLAFYFEQKADKEFNLLNQVNDETPVQVFRDGHMTEVPKKEVVVGDIVVLKTGDEVPADGTLLEAVSLMVDESMLTGEPSCSKTTNESDFDPNATFPSNHVLKGTRVMEGHAVYRVTAVGDQTENGKVFEAAQIDNSVKTPLNEQLEGLASLISKISYALAILIVVGRTLHFFLTVESYGWLDLLSNLLQTLMIAVTLIVVAVPEGLPMAVTLSLAYSMRRMLKTNNLVRKMHACETMGATTVICTDKTGTLTQNQMRVHDTFFYGLENQKLGDDEMSKLIVEGISVNSTASLDLTAPEEPKVLGNPTEGALLLWLHGHGKDAADIKSQVRILEEVPFSTERKYMATYVYSPVFKKRILYVKGAPEIVAKLCQGRIVGGKEYGELEGQLLDCQRQAMRTLGFAYQMVDDEQQEVIRDNAVVASDLTFIGFVAIADPVRADVPAAVDECLRAGINIKIVTGDTPTTAREIGRQIGLWKAQDDVERSIITGPEFAALTDEELERRISDLKIIARARPMDKKRLVETLQKKGEVVAVTGDGTNDAPALKAAHVGLSMGDGTSVAKEASDITIIDNSFASIARAVMWGRSLYKNIQRFVLFQVTVNVVACLIVLIGAFIGEQSPLTVTQMLWVNLIMDTFAAMALASLPPSEAVMNEKPRPRTAFIINRAMQLGIVGTGLLFTVILLVLVLLFQRYDITCLTDFGELALHHSAVRELSPYELSLFFTIFVLLQFWNMFNAKAFDTQRSAFHFKGCSGFVFIAWFILIGQILIVTYGGKMFNVVPLKVVDWGLIIVITSLVLWVGELRRMLCKSRVAAK